MLSYLAVLWGSAAKSLQSSVALKLFRTTWTLTLKRLLNLFPVHPNRWWFVSESFEFWTNDDNSAGAVHSAVWQRWIDRWLFGSGFSGAPWVKYSRLTIFFLILFHILGCLLAAPNYTQTLSLLIPGSYFFLSTADFFFVRSVCKAHFKYDCSFDASHDLYRWWKHRSNCLSRKACNFINSNFDCRTMLMQSTILYEYCQWICMSCRRIWEATLFGLAP